MERMTTYEGWIRQEGIPIVEGYGIEDFREIKREPWSRTGGKGAYIQLKGMEGFTGMYIGEIPPGGLLNPERHIYDEVIYILQGRGATEVWWGNGDGRKVSFEWGEGGVFAVPLNSTHRLYKGGERAGIVFGGNQYAAADGSSP